MLLALLHHRVTFNVRNEILRRTLLCDRKKMFTRFTYKSPLRAREGVKRKGFAKNNRWHKERKCTRLGDTVKEDPECTRGGACVPNDSEGEGRDGGRMMETGRHEEGMNGRAAGHPGSENPEKYVIVSSTVITKNRTNERTAGTSGWIWRVLAYALFPSHHLPLGWILVSLPPPPLSFLALFFFLPSRCLHLRASISATDAVIVRCSSRCIVVRNNDFIKIHAKGRRWHRREPVWWKGREGGGGRVAGAGWEAGMRRAADFTRGRFFARWFFSTTKRIELPFRRRTDFVTHTHIHTRPHAHIYGLPSVT